MEVKTLILLLTSVFNLNCKMSLRCIDGEGRGGGDIPSQNFNEAGVYY